MTFPYMHIMYFDHSHLYYSFLFPSLLSPFIFPATSLVVPILLS
jgi:hypothetical protein